METPAIINRHFVIERLNACRTATGKAIPITPNLFDTPYSAAKALSKMTFWPACRS
jgi:hypothetical protein